LLSRIAFFDSSNSWRAKNGVTIEPGGEKRKDQEGRKGRIRRGEKEKARRAPGFFLLGKRGETRQGGICEGGGSRPHTKEVGGQLHIIHII
jgi:hypothetical protein